jgi:histidinol-phosphate aminotransferase
MKVAHPKWVADLRPYEPGKPVEELEREMGITGAVKLASNENPRGPSPKAMEAMKQAVANSHVYPDAGTHCLRQRLADRLGVAMDEILIGNGSNELLTLLVRAFATSSDHAVVSEASFIAYRVVLGSAGVPVTYVPVKEHFEQDLVAMAAACTESTRILFLANPNNPTGTYCRTEDVEAFLEAVPPHVLVVIDEAYSEYVQADDCPDAISLRGLRENLVITRTFSKAYGLAGIRVGYAVAPPYVVELVNRIREPFNVSHLAQVAAMAALDDQEFVEASVALNHQEKALLGESLDGLGLCWIPSEGNFLLVESPIGGKALYEKLLVQGIIIRPLLPYGLKNHVRITVGLPAENKRLMEALSTVLS